MSVQADTCRQCGERYYSPDTIHLFERVRFKLECHDTSDLTPVGRAFEMN